MPRASLLEPCLQLSLHTAPDILRVYTLCSCGYNRGRIREWQLDFLISSCCDSHQCGVGVLVLHLYTLIHTFHTHGFAFLEP